MLSEFEGSFYNGISSRKYNVNILFESDFLAITTEDGTHIQWEYTKIKNLELLSKESAVVFYDTFPPQTLEVNSKSFINLISQKVKSKSFFEEFYRTSILAKNAVYYLLSIVIGLALLIYFYLIPTGMDHLAANFPRNWEENMGNRIKESILFPQDHEQEELDSLRTISVNDFFKEINSDTLYNVQVIVINSPVKNAFALPGGYIVIYSGILKEMKHYKELAALLGHEYGHIYYRHTLKALFKTLSNYILISAVFGDVSGITAVILENASSIKQLSFTRELESQSDMYGYELLKRNRIDPRGMSDLFERLKNDTIYTSKIPEFLQTHPKLESRIEVINNLIKKDKIVSKENAELEKLWKNIAY